MTHSDDDGLILPPRIASSHIVILPVIHKEETKAEVLSYCHSLAGQLRHLQYEGRALNVIVDEREMRGGDKLWSWVKKGVPMRIEVGPRDIAGNRLPVTRRDRGHRDFIHQSREELLSTVIDQLEDIQQTLFNRARQFRDAHIKKIDTKEEFYSFFTAKNKDNPEIHGGFALCHWSEDLEAEEQIKKDLGVTIRCIPLDAPLEHGHCPFTGKKSFRRVIYAKAY
jgi:prolyl-tRNA synthetase